MRAATTPGVDQEFQALGPEGFLPVCFRQWGDTANPRVLICVHGLSRNRLDFEAVGAAFGHDYRVLAPDMPGRGESGWLADKTAYTYDLYARICATLIAIAGSAQVDWIGTSMGGIIGMRLAAEANSPIRRLVMNDIGPFIPAAGRRDNVATFGTDPRFRSIDEAVAWHKVHRAGFGPMPDDAWREMTLASLRQTEDGGYALHYDPGLAVNQNPDTVADIELWPVWERITCPVLTIWGTASKLLLAPAIEQMKARGPGTRVVPVDGVGHAPAVAGDHVLGEIRRFLGED